MVVLLTRSRGGLIASSIVLFLSIFLLLFDARKKFSIKQKLAVLFAFLIFLGLSLFSVDLDGLAQRLQGSQLRTDAQIRNAYSLATLEAARTFWPWGSGLGTFEAVFPRFQPDQTPGYVTDAHNDYAQLLMEAGLAGVCVILALMTLIGLQVVSLSRVLRLRRGKRMPVEISLRCYAGLGAFALILHSWVEFNMHIPALAICAAFLMGVFLRPLVVEESGKGTSARIRIDLL